MSFLTNCNEKIATKGAIFTPEGVGGKPVERRGRKAERLNFDSRERVKQGRLATESSAKTKKFFPSFSGSSFGEREPRLRPVRDGATSFSEVDREDPDRFHGLRRGAYPHLRLAFLQGGQ